MRDSRRVSLVTAFVLVAVSSCDSYSESPPSAPAVTVEDTAHTGPSAGTPHEISFDRYSLLIDGQRLTLWAGEFHYWRLPSPDLWRDVLEKMKAAGYNAANIYFHWGYHSPAPGVYDFTGIRDVDRLLDIATEVGIYVIARPGPYINAETDGGGLPPWLDRLAGDKRTVDPAYTAYSDEWLAQISPILARHQLTNGTGTILFTQVENEFYDGSAAARDYMQHISDRLKADGITVPLIGNHNGVYNAGVGAVAIDGWDSYPQGFNCSTPTRWSGVPDFSGVRASLTDRPLFFVEYQGGAFDFWGGPGYEACRTLTGPDFEKVFYATNIAVGATLHSFYMTFGGTSWGYLPFPGVYTSYDYGAAITEHRQLTGKYSQQKLVGYLLAAAAPLTRTDALPAPSQTNTNLWLRGRVNPEDGTQLYVLRHADGASTDLDLTHLTLDLSGRTGYSHDDVDPAVTYTGAGWTHASGETWTAGDFGDTESFSASAGESLSVAFHGPAIRWLSSLDGNHGIARVAIDGELVATVDTYGPTKQYQYIAYQTFDLADADHVLTITATGQRNPSASGSFVVVDAVDLPPVAAGEFYGSVPQQPGTAIAIRGRDAKLLLANYRFGGQQLVYATAQLLTQAAWRGTDLAVLHAPPGEDSETVLRYATEPAVQVVSGRATATWNAARGDLRINANHGGLAKLVITGGGRPDLVLLLADEATASQFWRFDTRAGAVLARGPYLIRDARMSRGRLELRGDTSAGTTLEVYGPEVRELVWNGRRLHTDGDADPLAGPLTAALAGPATATLPSLTWRYRFDTPESEPGFDDFGWTLAGHATSLSEAANGSSPVLGGDEYGFHHGHLWYRGHFTALGSETSLFLSVSTGNSTGQLAAWLNGVYLGTGNGGTTLALPAGALRVGQDNVVSVLVANMGHDQGGSKAQRGLISARLGGSVATISWRVQGALGGERPVDPVRGSMNAGGLHGERAGWFLPGFPDRHWQPVPLPFTDPRPGVAWYRTHFDLDLPRGHDVPIVLRFEERSSRAYRAQIYLNGWNLGLYVNNVGPQRDFVLPAGLLRDDGDNTLALAVWSNDAAGGLGPVSLAAVGSYRGGPAIGRVRSPAFDERQYAEPVSPAQLVLRGPDRMIRGSTATVTATLTVPRDRQRVSNAAITLALPAGWIASTATTVAVGALAPGRSATATWTVTAPAGEQPLIAMLTADARLTVQSHRPTTNVTAGKPIAVPPPAPTGDLTVSNIAFQSTNGWGPVERNTSNGEQAAGDGRPMRLRGTVFAQGLGAHAPGDITVFLGGRCSSFSAIVGVDDETGGGGSVRFRVVADDREVAATGVVTGSSAPVALSADLTGAEWLDLIVDDGGDGNGLDHADWANAAIHCAP